MVISDRQSVAGLLILDAGPGALVIGPWSLGIGICDVIGACHSNEVRTTH
jgi:hypothetical protein